MSETWPVHGWSTRRLGTAGWSARAGFECCGQAPWLQEILELPRRGEDGETIVRRLGTYRCGRCDLDYKVDGQ